MSFETIPRNRPYAKRAKGVRISLRQETGKNPATLFLIFGPEVTRDMGWMKGAMLEVLRGRGADEGRVRVCPTAKGGNKLRSVTNSSVSLQVGVRAWDELGSQKRAAEQCTFRIAKNDRTALDVTLPAWANVRAFEGGSLMSA
jgi:hypothetical protein